MTYYLIKTTIEDNQETKQILAYKDLRLVLSAYHMEFASILAYDVIKSAMCMVVDQNGLILRSDTYKREEPETNYIEDVR